MTEALAEVQAVFEGSFPGEALDDPGEASGGVTFEACDIEGAPFNVTLTVGEPSCYDPDRPEDTDCTRTDRGYFPISGTIQVADDPAIALDGGVEVWSERGGLALWNTGGFGMSEGPYEYQTLDFVLSDDFLLADVEFRGLSWARRLTEESADVTVWQVCALPFE